MQHHPPVNPFLILSVSAPVLQIYSLLSVSCLFGTCTKPVLGIFTLH